MKNSTHPNVNIGDLAEDKFRVWCTLAGASATKASPDRMGWDYFVEWDSCIDPNVPQDMQGWLPKILVQVKSTKGLANKIKIKLSAVKKLVDTDLPAFIIFQIFNNNFELVESKLLHIDESIISNVLKSVREAEADGDVVFNKRYFYLRPADGCSVDLTDPFSFDYIKNLSNNKEYQIWKSDIRNRVGFESDSIKVQIWFGASIKNNHLEDMMIGIGPELPVESMRVSRERFGIIVPSDIQNFEQIRVRIAIESKNDGVLRVVSNLRGDYYEIPVNYVASPVHGLNKVNRIRIFNNYFELVGNLSGGDFLFSFRLDFDTRVNLAEFIDVMRFIILLDSESSHLELHVSGVRVLDAQVSVSNLNSGPLIGSLRLLELVDYAAKNIGYKNNIDISMYELNDEVSRISDFVRFLNGEDSIIHISIQRDIPSEFWSASVALMYSEFINLGGLQFCVTLSSPAKVEVQEREIKFKLVGMERLDGFVVGNAGLSRDFLSKRLDRLFRAKYKSDFNPVSITPDFKWVVDS